MSRARNRKANPEKYAGKEYLSYEESIDFLGISLSTLVRYINDENIKTEKFYRDKKKYLAMGDVKLIEDLIKNPWKRTAPSSEKGKSAPVSDGSTQNTLILQDDTSEAVEGESSTNKPAA